MGEPLRAKTSLPTHQKRYVSLADKEIINEWLNLRPVCTSVQDAVTRTSINLCIPEKHVITVVRRAALKEAAKEHADTLAREVIKGKSPLLKEIVNLSLQSLLEWVTEFKEKGQHRKMTVTQAKQFSSFITDLNTISRLEVGEPTHIFSGDIKVVHEKTDETVQKIFEVISADPVMNPNANLNDGTIIKDPN